MCHDDFDRSKLPLIQTNKEQEKAASEGIHPDSFVAMILLPEDRINNFPWTWKVEFITDSLRDADEWFESRNRGTRLYYGNGHIRSAK